MSRIIRFLKKPMTIQRTNNIRSFPPNQENKRQKYREKPISLSGWKRWDYGVPSPEKQTRNCPEQGKSIDNPGQ
jgi:hypothetical protein